jgi:AraC-like DNA-binding protein
MSTISTHSFPGTHVLQLASCVARFGVGIDKLLQGSRYTEASLADPGTRVGVDDLVALTERARMLSAEPGLGFYLGLQRRLSMYGYVGFAAMNAATLKEALELSVRFTHVVTTALSLELMVEEDSATLRIHEHADMGPAHDVAVFSLLLGLQTVTTHLTGRGPDRVVADIPFRKPTYFPRFAHLLPDARFNQPVLALHFSRAALDIPLLTPDRAALLLLQQACEKELEKLGFDGSLAMRVRRQLVTPDGVQRIERVARALRLSARTLKRKLAAEGVSYTELLEAERKVQGMRLLRESSLPLHEVATRLDYSTLPNFARAFRRWTGESPAQFRRRVAGARRT